MTTLTFTQLSNQTPHWERTLLLYARGLWEGFMLKVANYRRAIWLAAGGPTLEVYVRQRLDACPDVASTKFEYKPGILVQIANRSIGQGLACYLTLFAEGSPAATVDNGGPNIHRRAAPAGEEFLKTGIYLVMEGNHVGYVANGLTNEGQITGLLHKFLKAHGAPDDATQFALLPRADRREIEKLLRAGVKSIDLGVSAFVSTIEDMNDAVAHEQQGAADVFLEGAKDIGRGLWRILSTGRTPQEIEIASELQAKVHIGYDGRGSGALLPALLGKIGESVSESSDDFKIVTTQDVVITKDKLVIKREIYVDGDDVALEPLSAFTAIRLAMADWRQAGLFDQ